ncbi:hypothetical protein SYNTR_0861 [Candidatus Syntrophocurvum alkaliphilum]|uniref:Carbon monoxide oxidation accessory protein CoxE n=1 Tax=Candidatus Syntrophocurvum alkaliphilum TaxID=2293317 RepID=A0A6I6DFS7_9FIRM|nr:VWA domain-containing protein [Candidatus Syntrophocurvum alkaliphilum]QGT99454.1 hypothetical protein SYNTR_0861 [Candidatus Syntrophocurvum alkaliphilum]
MSLFYNLQEFFEQLRQEGLPVSPGQANDCFQALLHVDWLIEDAFYSAMSSTLVKNYSYQAIFDDVYKRYFIDRLPGQYYSDHHYNQQNNAIGNENISNEGSEFAQGLPLNSKSSSQAPPGGNKNPLEIEFNLANLDDIHKMERLFPVIARRLAAKMIKVHRRNDQNNLNYRRTIRQSMSTGGIPVDIITSKKIKQKPVLLVLCDVSGSVMNFSCFALALLASLERFFRHIHSYGFIDEIDNISQLLISGNPLTLRTHVLKHSRVVGGRGYTDYGAVFKAFQQRHSQLLNHKTTVLIFGDARNNWFRDETWALQEIRNRVKKIYWFNPESYANWNTGDSRMSEYLIHCDDSFSCTNLLEMEKAFEKL